MMNPALPARVRCLLLALLAAPLFLLSSLQASATPRILSVAVPGGRLQLSQDVDPASGFVRHHAWTLVSRQGKEKRLGDHPAAMNAIHQLSASPDGRFLAVLSAGEGHPVLEISPLAPLLQGHDLAPRITLNPYPQGITVRGWERDGLRVATPVLLTRAGRDGFVPIVLDLEEDQDFLVDPTRRQVSALSERARHPEAWFRSRLASDKPTHVLTAASALATLGATSALPDLRRALGSTQEPHCRKAIQDAITTLERKPSSPPAAPPR